RTHRHPYFRPRYARIARTFHAHHFACSGGAMSSRRIRKGDDVIVNTGKDRGRRGAVLEVLPNDRVLVEGLNIVKKHVRPNPNEGIQGGIEPREMPLHVSKVMLYNPQTGKGERVGFK